MQILARSPAPKRSGKVTTNPQTPTKTPLQDGARTACDAQRCAAPVARSGGVELGVLGTYAKTSSALPIPGAVAWVPTDDGTGELRAFERKGVAMVEHKSMAQIRIERYRLKGVVNGILPGSRTHKCHRWRVPAQTLRVMHSAEHGKAFYAGLQVCASVWLCPICAPKISERRRVELKAAIDEAINQGLTVMLMTLTVPHGLGDDLGAMLDRMMTAYADTSSDRSGIAARKAFALVGTVRVLEVTHGRNGWHPHFHVLLFVAPGKNPEEVQAIMTPVWQSACVKRGLPRPSDEHGVDVRGGHEAASYAAKWGLEHEMTKGHLKAPRDAKGLTPWGLLLDCLETKSHRSRLLWTTYAAAFKGRRQLCWSKGLRKLLQVEELDDAEIVAKEDAAAVILAELEDDQWRDVLLTHSEASLLQVAEEDPQSLQAFLLGVSVLARAMGGPPPVVAGVDRRNRPCQTPIVSASLADLKFDQVQVGPLVLAESKSDQVIVGPLVMGDGRTVVRYSDDDVIKMEREAHERQRIADAFLFHKLDNLRSQDKIIELTNVENP